MPSRSPDNSRTPGRLYSRAAWPARTPGCEVLTVVFNPCAANLVSPHTPAGTPGPASAAQCLGGIRAHFLLTGRWLSRTLSEVWLYARPCESSFVVIFDGRLLGAFSLPAHGVSPAVGEHDQWSDVQTRPVAARPRAIGSKRAWVQPPRAVCLCWLSSPHPWSALGTGPSSALGQWSKEGRRPSRELSTRGQMDSRQESPPTSQDRCK